MRSVHKQKRHQTLYQLIRIFQWWFLLSALILHPCIRHTLHCRWLPVCTSTFMDAIQNVR